MRAPLRMPSFAPPTDSVLAHAIWHVGQQTTVADSVRIENAVLRDRAWTQAERDLIRLAAISRRMALTHRNDCCTVTEPEAARSPSPGS
jgi:beta-xylosidase